MFIRHLLLKNFQSLSCLFVKGRVFSDKISVRSVSSLVRRPKPKRHYSSKTKKKTTKKKKPTLSELRESITKISVILRISTWDDAHRQLQALPIKWESFIVTQVLRTHPPMEKAWLFFNWAKKLKGFKHDQYSYTTMLDIFGEARRIPSMMFVFDEMRKNGIKIDAITYTSLMHWLANDGDVDGAVTLWEELRHMDSITVVSYTAYIKILLDHNREKEAAEVYKELLQLGFTPNCQTYTVLMVHLANSGKFDKVMEIFMGMQDARAPPDKAACNILIEKCCEAGKTSEMTRILMYMKANALVLRYQVYVKAMNAFSNAGESNVLLRQVNRHLSLRYSLENTPEVKKPTSDEINILSLLEKKNLDAIDHLLSNAANGSMQLDSKLISTIIEVNVGSERQSGAVVAFDYCVNNGISINSSAYRALIGMFVRKNLSVKVVEIVEKMIQEGLSLGTQLSAVLIYRLGCAREPVAAATVFNVLPVKEKNTATYTALIGAYFASGDPDKALQMFDTMTAQGIKVALGTECILLAGLQKSGRGKLVVSYRKEIKSLQAESISQVTEEEMICNLLFSGKLLV